MSGCKYVQCARLMENISSACNKLVYRGFVFSNVVEKIKDVIVVRCSYTPLAKQL